MFFCFFFADQSSPYSVTPRPRLTTIVPLPPSTPPPRLTRIAPHPHLTAPRPHLITQRPLPTAIQPLPPDLNRGMFFCFFFANQSSPYSVTSRPLPTTIAPLPPSTPPPRSTPIASHPRSTRIAACPPSTPPRPQTVASMSGDADDLPWPGFELGAMKMHMHGMSR